MMKQIKKIGFWFLVLFLLILICLPGIWIFISAFRPNPEILAKPANWIPDRWTIYQFTQMFSINGYVSVPAFKYLMNSIIISSGVVSVSILGFHVIPLLPDPNFAPLFVNGSLYNSD